MGEVIAVVGNQLLRFRWAFVQAPSSERTSGQTAWRVDAEEPLPFDPPGYAALVLEKWPMLNRFVA